MHVCTVEKQNMCELVQNISCVCSAASLWLWPCAAQQQALFFLHNTDSLFKTLWSRFGMWAEHSSAAVVPARHGQLQSLAAAAHAALIGPVGEVEGGVQRRTVAAAPLLHILRTAASQSSVLPFVPELEYCVSVTCPQRDPFPEGLLYI